MAVLRAKGADAGGGPLPRALDHRFGVPGRIEANTTLGGRPAIIPSISGRAWISGRRTEDARPDGPLAAGLQTVRHLADVPPLTRAILSPRTLSRMHKIQVIDSHTGGEPTRVVVAGGPDLGTRTARRAARRASAHELDRFRSAVVNEPRGSDVLVGALLVEPADRSCAAGVIFFNNVGYLGMCGHGTIGLVVTLAHLGRIRPGAHRIETPVGIVTATLHDDGRGRRSRTCRAGGSART